MLTLMGSFCRFFRWDWSSSPYSIPSREIWLKYGSFPAFSCHHKGSPPDSLLLLWFPPSKHALGKVGIESAMLHKEPGWPHIMGYLSLILTMPETDVEDCPLTLSLSQFCHLFSVPTTSIIFLLLLLVVVVVVVLNDSQYSDKRRSPLGILWWSSG